MKHTAPRKKNQWQDHYTRQAKKEHFPARSVYKLQEIQQKHQLIKKGYKVLDLGCSPGSWLLYAAKLTGDRGRVVGIDLKPVTGRSADPPATLADMFDMLPVGVVASEDEVVSTAFMYQAPPPLVLTSSKHIAWTHVPSENTRPVVVARVPISRASRSYQTIKGAMTRLKGRLRGMAMVGMLSLRACIFCRVAQRRRALWRIRQTQ